MIGLMERLRVRVMECLLGREINCLIVCLGVWVGPPVVLRNLSRLALWQRNTHRGIGSVPEQSPSCRGSERLSRARIREDRTSGVGEAGHPTHPPAPARSQPKLVILP